MKEGVGDTAPLAASRILSLSHVYYHEQSRHSLDLSTHHKLLRRFSFQPRNHATATLFALHSITANGSSFLATTLGVLISTKSAAKSHDLSHSLTAH